MLVGGAAEPFPAFSDALVALQPSEKLLRPHEYPILERITHLSYLPNVRAPHTVNPEVSGITVQPHAIYP